MRKSVREEEEGHWADLESSRIEPLTSRNRRGVQFVGGVPYLGAADLTLQAAGYLCRVDTKYCTS